MSSYFGDTYAACRDRFLTHAAARGATLATYSIAAPGPAGSPLSIDTAYIGTPAPANLLVLMSGTHGVEGFAGSACQSQFLAEDCVQRSLPPDAAVLLVHALNPYGFAWGRRVNEQNVDVNRNFLDHTGSPPMRPDYVAHDAIINPTECTEATDAAFVEAAVQLASARGMPYVQAMLTNGQYECPQGIYYGGREPQESNVRLREIFREQVAPAARALLIDFHTGLGDAGVYTILADHPSDVPAFAFLERTFPAGRVESTIGGQSISAELHGEIATGIVQDIPDVEWLACACEFGTVPGPQVIQALRHENWLHHHGDRDSARGRDILAALRAAFCPESPAWRAAILAGGREVLAHAWRGLFGPDAA